MRLKKLLPYLILLLVVLCGYMLYTREGFTATISCSCPTGYVVGTTSSTNDKCYKCSSGTYSGGTCSGTLDVKFKTCTCTNSKTPTCSDGKKAVNNKCYNCDPSNPTYNTPTLMTIPPYVNTIRCTVSGIPTATSKTAYEVTNGLFCPS